MAGDTPYHLTKEASFGDKKCYKRLPTLKYQQFKHKPVVLEVLVATLGLLGMHLVARNPGRPDIKFRESPRGLLLGPALGCTSDSLISRKPSRPTTSSPS